LLWIKEIKRVVDDWRRQNIKQLKLLTRSRVKEGGNPKKLRQVQKAEKKIQKEIDQEDAKFQAEVERMRRQNEPIPVSVVQENNRGSFGATQNVLPRSPQMDRKHPSFQNGNPPQNTENSTSSTKLRGSALPGAVPIGLNMTILSQEVLMKRGELKATTPIKISTAPIEQQKQQDFPIKIVETAVKSTPPARPERSTLRPISTDSNVIQPVSNFGPKIIGQPPTKTIPIKPLTTAEIIEIPTKYTIKSTAIPQRTPRITKSYPSQNK